MTEAVGYTRLSQESDLSIPRQKRNIREYAADHGWDLLDVLDDGERASGFDPTREAYQRLLGLTGEVDALVVNDRRRITRETQELMTLLPKLREEGVEFHTCSDGRVAFDDVLDLGFEVMRSAVEQKAKQAEIKRARAAIAERQEDGYYQGGVPFGLRVADDKGLERDPDEWGDVERVLESDVVGAVVDDVAVSPATAYNIADRGRGYYERLLEVYG